MKKYYFDTSIWLDFFENRDEPNLPKGTWAHELLDKIIKIDAKIVYSDHVLLELSLIGYPPHEIEELFKPLKPLLIFVESTEKEMGRAYDLALRRKIPTGDALHALIARDHHAILVTLDHHFKEVLDIITPKRPQDLIEL